MLVLAPLLPFKLCHMQRAGSRPKAKFFVSNDVHRLFNLCIRVVQCFLRCLVNTILWTIAGQTSSPDSELQRTGQLSTSWLRQFGQALT